MNMSSQSHRRWSYGLFLVLGLLALVVWCTSLSSAAQSSADVIVTGADDGTQVQINEGQLLIVKLVAQPGAGYSWSVDGSLNLVRQIGESSFEAIGSDDLHNHGAPVLQVLTFQPIVVGQGDLKIVYRRPWEKDTQPARTFTIHIDTQGRFVSIPALDASPTPEQSAPAPELAQNSTVPAAFNWCDQGVCTPIKDQSNNNTSDCGSCWAFATVGVVEAAIQRIDHVTRDLSEQYLISSGTYGTCHGGGPAFDMFIDVIPPGENQAGSVYESEFPYVGRDTLLNPPHTHHEKLISYTEIGSNIGEIKQAILDHGPIYTSVCSGNAFEYYESGVFQTNETCLYETNHAVILVGWDDSKYAWRLRNSWGSNWGENGYMWIRYGTSNIGRYNNIYVSYGESNNIYSIMGRISDVYGTALSGVTVSDGTRSATSDSYGAYTLIGVPAGSYTLTPSRSGYSFTPATRSVTVNANLTQQNFVVVSDVSTTYTVSGWVVDAEWHRIAGVTVSDGTRSATSDSYGAYTLIGVPAGSYTLTPSRSGYSFTPATRSVTVNANLTQQNFVALNAVNSYTVSGWVLDEDGYRMAGVTVSDGTRSATSDSYGAYTLIGVPAGSYTLTPSHSGYSFTPATRSVTVNANLTQQNFVTKTNSEIVSLFLPLIKR